MKYRDAETDREDRKFWAVMAFIIVVSAVITFGAAKADNKVIQACVDKGGVVVNSMQGFVCVRKEFLINIEVE